MEKGPWLRERIGRNRPHRTVTPTVIPHMDVPQGERGRGHGNDARVVIRQAGAPAADVDVIGA